MSLTDILCTYRHQWCGGGQASLDEDSAHLQLRVVVIAPKPLKRTALSGSLKERLILV